MTTPSKKKTSTYYELLKADFAAEALSVDNSRGFNLTSIKAQYIKERLNEVLGVSGWALTGEFHPVDGGVLYLGVLTVTVDGITHSHESPGFSQNKKNVGDTYKSAQTDALSKCASFFGVGNEVFKGNVAPPVSKAQRAAPAARNTARSSWKS